jgi:malate dehydrogenase (oxaloacetate-decarboxylating)(NADP+)
VFLGCSTAGVLTPEMVGTMAARPIILALANPEPEIRPELAKKVRPDCIIATGRSDYPNQVNNVLCFPYIFRGALDAGATSITEAMKLACVREIADLAKAEISDEVAAAYAGQELAFGPDYIIPKPFDSRLILRIAPAVAEAARASGVAARPVENLETYRQSLARFVTYTAMFMRPIFEGARARARRVIYAEGEDERVLRAVQLVLDERLAQPTLIGRPAVITARAQRAGLRFRPGIDVPVVDPEDDPRFREYWSEYHALMCRRGTTPEMAKAAVRRSTTTIAALAVRRGDADAMICGLVGRFESHLEHVCDVVGLARGKNCFATLNALMLPQQTLFITDTFVNDDPSAGELAEIAAMAAEAVRRFGLPPKVAFVSHSMFGSSERPSARKMRAAHRLFAAACPDVECDGEMHGDAALSEEIRKIYLPQTTLVGGANVLVMPNLDSANIAFNLLKVTGGHGITVGPILLGAALPAHILTPSATVRRVVNMTALAVVEAGMERRIE